MQKKGKNEINLSAKAGKIALNFCRANNRDVDEFLEEAIMEKIEFEEMNNDNLARRNGDTAADIDDLLMEGPFDAGYRKKH